MANNLGDVLEEQILRYYFGGTVAAVSTTMTKPTAWFVSLHTAAGGTSTESNASWTATELSNMTGASSYSRAAIQLTSISTGGISGAVGSFSSTTFLQAQANWGTVTHLGVWDASAITSSSNVLFWIPLSASVVVNSLDTVTVGNAAITLAMD